MSEEARNRDGRLEAFFAGSDDPELSRIPDLAVDIDYISELHKLREEALSLLDRGIEGLVGDRFEWEQAEDQPSVVERVLLRRVMHVAMRRGVLEDPGGPAHAQRLERLLQKEWFDSTRESVQVFSAANVVRGSLDDDVGYFDPNVLVGLYVIVRELYLGAAPDWAIGGARAGMHEDGGGPVSAFVTSECAGALNHLRVRLKRTAAFLALVYDLDVYQKQVDAAHNPDSGGRLDFAHLEEVWCENEMKRLSFGLRATLIDARGQVLLKVPPVSPDATVSELMPQIHCAVRRFLVASHASVMATMAMLQAAWVKEWEGLQSNPPQGALDSADSVAWQRRTNLKTQSTSAHQTAMALLERISRVLGQLISVESDADELLALSAREEDNLERDPRYEISIEKVIPDPADAPRDSEQRLLSLAESCSSGAHRMVELLAPIVGFMRGRILRSIYERELHRAVHDAPELAFAASTLGALLGDWSDSLFARTHRILAETLDERGRFPTGSPFQLRSHASQQHPANAQVIGAFSSLLKHSPGPLEVRLMRRLLSYYRDEALHPNGRIVRGQRPPNRTSTEDAEPLAWNVGRASARGKPSKWISASTVLSLSSFCAMLNKKIDDRVKRHFRVRTKDELAGAPTIDQLMCTDIGLAAQRTGRTKAAGRSPEDRLVTLVLDQMRAHLIGNRASGATAGKVVCSAVFYGPPGTGKTTLLNSLALSSGRDLVEITPSDFIVSGTESVEMRSSAIMKALSYLRHSVVLFDEFESVLHKRSPSDPPPENMFQFMPSAMLPKLTELNRAAKEHGLVYVLATNFFDNLDEAAVRRGRFDDWVGVYPPDPASRMCRLVARVKWWIEEVKIKHDEAASEAKVDRSLEVVLEQNKPQLSGANKVVTVARKKKKVVVTISRRQLELRMARIVAKSAGVPIVELCRKNWFTAPKVDKRMVDSERELLSRIETDSAWGYIFGRRDDEPIMPMPTARATSEPKSPYEPSLLHKVQLTAMRTVDTWNAGLLGMDLTRSASPWGDLRSRLQALSKDSIEPMWLELETWIEEQRRTSQDGGAGQA